MGIHPQTLSSLTFSSSSLVGLLVRSQHGQEVSRACGQSPGSKERQMLPVRSGSEPLNAPSVQGMATLAATRQDAKGLSINDSDPHAIT